MRFVIKPHNENKPIFSLQEIMNNDMIGRIFHTGTDYLYIPISDNGKMRLIRLSAFLPTLGLITTTELQNRKFHEFQGELTIFSK